VGSIGRKITYGPGVVWTKSMRIYLKNN
jgi:hypothetical protein